jgi:hypothetical protein
MATCMCRSCRLLHQLHMPPLASSRVHPTLAAPCMCRNLQDAHCNLQQQHSGQTTACTTGTPIAHKLAGCAPHQRPCHHCHLPGCTLHQGRLGPATPYIYGNLQAAHCSLHHRHSGLATACTTNTLQRGPCTTGTLHMHELVGCAISNATC